VAEAGKICAYCGQPVLTGNEKPEHAIPAALGSSLTVYTVCDPCNEWVGKEVDQPFLEDEWVRVHRSDSGVVDPRRGRRGRPTRSPLLEGYTDDGDHVSLGHNGKPRMRSRIIDLGDGKFQIRADSVDEMERLKRRVERRTGKTITDENITHQSTNPQVRGRLTVNTLLWLREAAKIGLAIGSIVYPEEWRTGPDAERLREWLSGKDGLAPPGQPIGLVPQQIAGTPIETFVTEPEHLVFFQRAAGRTMVIIVLLGSVYVSLPVDTTGEAVPRVAWTLDPARPKANGETTFDALMVNATERIIAESPAQTDD
jgi:HNH endonuclease